MDTCPASVLMRLDHFPNVLIITVWSLEFRGSPVEAPFLSWLIPPNVVYGQQHWVLDTAFISATQAACWVV